MSVKLHTPPFSHRTRREDITWETQMSENNIKLTLKEYDIKRGRDIPALKQVAASCKHDNKLKDSGGEIS